MKILLRAGLACVAYSGLVVFAGPLRAESETLSDQISFIASEPGRSDQCVKVQFKNSSKQPIGRLTFHVSFLDHDDRAVWSTIRQWSYDGKYTENLEMEKGPFLPGSTRTFEACGGPNMQIAEWDRPRVGVQFRQVSRYVDLAQFDALCSRALACDKNERNQQLLKHPQACQKMFASIEASPQTASFGPPVYECIQLTPCNELDVFKCFSKAAQEAPPRAPMSTPSPRPESKIP